MAAGEDVDRLARDVDAGEVAPDVDDLAQRLQRALARHLGDVERHRAVGEAAALVDLGLLGPRHHVARGQLELVGRVALHEALAVGVVEVRPLAARALRDQDPVARQRRRVVLDHLHVHQRRADAVGLRDPVARADQGVGGRLEALARPTGGLDDALRGEQLHRPVADVARDRAAARAVVVLHHRRHEPLLEAVDLRVVLHELLVEHVQQRLAGDIGHVVGACGRGAAEGARAELALGIAVEGDSAVLEPQHLARRLAAHHLDRVLVAEIVRALDRVVGVRLPRVVGVERGVDAARGRVGVRADRVDLGHDGHGRPGLGGREGGPLAGEAGADDQDVVGGHEARVYWRTTGGRAPRDRSCGVLRRPAARPSGAPCGVGPAGAAVGLSPVGDAGCHGGGGSARNRSWPLWTRPSHPNPPSAACCGRCRPRAAGWR